MSEAKKDRPSDATEVPSEAFLSGFNAGRNGTKDYDVHQAWATYLRFGGQRTNSDQFERCAKCGMTRAYLRGREYCDGAPDGQAPTHEFPEAHADVRGSGAAGRDDATPVAAVGADGGAGAGPHHAGDAAWEAGAAGGAGVGGGDPVATFDAWAKGRTFVDEERTTSATVQCCFCKHDVPEDTTRCMAGVGTQCKDSAACRARRLGASDAPACEHPSRRLTAYTLRSGGWLTRCRACGAVNDKGDWEIPERSTDYPTAWPDMPAWAGDDVNDERPLPEDAEIQAAFPTRSGRHDLYGEAMRLVGARRSKGGLVALVTWLLLRAETTQKRRRSP